MSDPTPAELVRDCSTCLHRTKPDDVDWAQEPCETCVHLHVSKSRTPWPMWSQRTPAQIEADRAALAILERSKP